ncbi:MAG: hypothetical protein J1F67_06645 [Muribaculaceae bacterium]|nr:hypothetical protein [Muribaculaceae bacterium]
MASLKILYINNTDANKATENLEVKTTAVAKSFQVDGIEYTFKLELSGLEIKKKIYSPNEITAYLSFTKTDTADDVFPTAEVLSKMFLGKPASVNADGAGEMINLFVFEVIPKMKKDSSKTMIVLTLKIFSADKLMAIDKYSQAYSGRKLRRELIESCNRFILPLNYYKENSESARHNITIEIDKDKSTSGNTQTETTLLQHLADGTYEKTIIENDKEYKFKVQSEFIHPYLVQYNETFYDFLVRTANRCGEFLYFEDGKLKIGLPLTLDKDKFDSEDEFSGETKSKYVIKNIGSPIEITGFEEIEMANSTHGVLKVEDYSRNSLAEGVTISQSASTNNHAEISGGYNVNQIYKNTGERKSITYPGDTNFNKNGYYYNSEIAHDEFFMPLYRDGFGGTKFVELNRGSEGKHITHAISTVLNSTSLFELITNAAIEYLELGALNLMYNSTMSDRGKERFIQTNSPSNISNINGTSFKSEPDVVVPSSENKSERWTTLEYYSEIKKYEELQSSKVIKVNMGASLKNLKLGQIVKIPSFNSEIYIITEVEVELTGSTSTQRFKGIPLYRVDSGTTSNTEKVYYYISYPPLLDKEVFRKSGPQTAFVVDTADPKRQGRVKIKYPWQNSDDKIPYDSYITIPKKEEEVWDKYQNILKQGISPWVRMASPSASGGSGIYFEPEPGDEVLVNFENDNVERPYVVGALYSKNHTAPAGKGRRVLVSKFGHMIRFKDPSDGVGELSESTGLTRLMSSFSPLLSTASFWLSSYIPDVTDSNIDKMTGGIDIGDAFGFYSISASSDERAIKISSPLGDISLSAFTGITINAPNGNIKIAGKNVDISASNKVNITSGANIEQGNYLFSGLVEEGKTRSNLSKALKNKAADYLISSLMPIDLDLVRTLFEVVIRPVNGTLSIKSHGFLKLEAGEGKAEIPRNAYTDFYKYNVIDDDIKKNKVNDIHRTLANYIVEINRLVEGIYNIWIAKNSETLNLIAGFKNQYMGPNPVLKNITTIDQLITKLYETTKRPFTQNDINDVIVQGFLPIHLENRNAAPEDEETRREREEEQRIAQEIENENFQQYLNELNDRFEEIWNAINLSSTGYRHMSTKPSQYIKVRDEFAKINGKKLSNKLQNDFEEELKKNEDYVNLISDIDDSNKALNWLRGHLHAIPIGKYTSKMKRSLWKSLMNSSGKLFPQYTIEFDNNADIEDYGLWTTAVSNFSIKLREEKFSIGDFWENKMNEQIKKFIDGINVWNNRAEGKGKILISDNSGKTLTPSANGDDFESKDNEASAEVIMLNDALNNLKTGLNKM